MSAICAQHAENKTLFSITTCYYTIHTITTYYYILLQINANLHLSLLRITRLLLLNYFLIITELLQIVFNYYILFPQHYYTLLPITVALLHH